MVAALDMAVCGLVWPLLATVPAVSVAGLVAVWNRLDMWPIMRLVCRVVYTT